MGRDNNELLSSFEIIRRLSGDKWKFLIICNLFHGPKRFGELMYYVEPITKKVLTENLRELESLEIISRTSYAGNITKVEYALTDMGQTLQPVFQALIEWGLKYAHSYRQKIVGDEMENGEI